MNAMNEMRFAFLLGLVAIAQVGCETTSPQAGPAETAGREVDHAMSVAGNEAGRALNVAGDHTSHALNVAGREVNHASQEAGVFLQKFGKNLSDGSFW